MKELLKKVRSRLHNDLHDRLNLMQKQNDTLHGHMSILQTQCDELRSCIDNLQKSHDEQFIKINQSLLKQEYMTFRYMYKEAKLPKLALYRPKYPYGEIAVVRGGSSLEAFSNQQYLHHTCLLGLQVLSTYPVQTDSSGVSYVFGGIARWKDKLIVGPDDIKEYGFAAEELRESVGEFELLICDGQKQELSTDFFGLCKWYYFKSSNEVFAASTSYHLLLLVLKQIGVKMRLNTDKVLGGMAFFNPASAMSFTEIIANVRATLEHPKFEYVRCDLTGGLDSRAVLAAALTLPESLLDKLRIMSLPHANYSEDFKIANAIVNHYGLKWDDIPSKVSFDVTGIDSGLVCQANQSAWLGVYYLADYVPPPSKLEKAIRMNGFCGEMLLRSMHDLYIPSDHKNELDDKEILNNIGLDLKADIDYSSHAGRKFNEYLKRSISSLPGETIYEKLDLFYLYFRNRHQCRTKYTPISPTWAVLQSKAALRAKRMYVRKHGDSKLNYDIIAMLNPELAIFPFDTKKKSQNFHEYKNRLFVDCPAKKLELDHDTTAWKESKNKKPIQYLPDEASVKKIEEETRKWYMSERTLLSALKYVLDYSEDFEELGFPIWQFFTKDRYTKKYNFHMHTDNMRINRILSAYWQIRIIQDSDSHAE